MLELKGMKTLAGFVICVWCNARQKYLSSGIAPNLNARTKKQDIDGNLPDFLCPTFLYLPDFILSGH